MKHSCESIMIWVWFSATGPGHQDPKATYKSKTEQLEKNQGVAIFQSKGILQLDLNALVDLKRAKDKQGPINLNEQRQHFKEKVGQNSSASMGETDEVIQKSWHRHNTYK